jgi:hypothetical protein
MAKKYSTEKIKCLDCNLTISKPNYTEHLATKEHKERAVIIENT